MPDRGSSPPVSSATFQESPNPCGWSWPRPPAWGFPHARAWPRRQRPRPS